MHEPPCLKKLSAQLEGVQVVAKGSLLPDDLVGYDYVLDCRNKRQMQAS